ncbi:hypothetical protein ACFCZV_08760 [Streptomyces hydrogenans]|uniref:hypothetical protein n=1 Tax=Streptomyces hydrogenans TaxID=1873719 RepID=UPI0035DF0FA6
MHDVDKECATVRALTQTCHSPGRHEKRFAAFQHLTQKLLSLTVMADGQRVGLDRSWIDNRTRVLAGRSQDSELNTVRLRDGRCLRLTMTLRITSNDRLAVPRSSFQYQESEGDQTEIFRYDYLRAQKDEHPRSHLNIHGQLDRDVLRDGKALENVHFPTGRIPLEAVLRLLIVQFDVPAATPEEVWMRVLTTSETEFQAVCEQPLSGPEDLETVVAG